MTEAFPVKLSAVLIFQYLAKIHLLLLFWGTLFLADSFYKNMTVSFLS